MALAHLETAQIHLFHRRSAAASNSIDLAKARLGVKLELTGALGKRTKHQESALSLLVLKVHRINSNAPIRGVDAVVEEMSLAEKEGSIAGLPHCITEEDDQLLDAPKLEEEEEEEGRSKTNGNGTELPLNALRSIEQQVILAELGYVQATRPVHESTMEEIEPYMRAALALPRNWAVATQTLRLKARLESAKKRRRHQSLMQLEVLVDDVRPPKDASEGTFLSRHLGAVEGKQNGDAGAEKEATATPVDVTDAGGSVGVTGMQRLDGPRLSSRMSGFWAVGLGPRWHLGAELARTMAALGLLQEASKLFEELHLWEECVSAMAAMGHSETAEGIVRRRLEEEPTPNMCVHLGDLSKEYEEAKSCYTRAWELSNGSCAKAKLKLGSICMREEKFAEARAHLQDALKVKAHYAEAWYCSSVCLLKLEETDAALSEMRKVVALDPTHHQAWSSLGGLFAKKRMKREALFAFREACKLRGDSHSLWQHASLAALDLGRFEEAIYGAMHSLKLGGQPMPQISSLVAQAVAKDVKEEGGIGADIRRTRRLLPKARALLEASCNSMPLENVHWEARLHLEKECGTMVEVVECNHKRLEALMTHTKWKEEPGALDDVSEILAQLVEAVLEVNEPKETRRVKAIVETTLYAASDKLAATPGCESLRMLKSRIDRHDDD